MTTFFQTLIRPDREESAQRAEVAKAANLLQVGEFQFLQLAYSEWHGEEMSEELINHLFMAYMLYDQVPLLGAPPCAPNTGPGTSKAS